MNNVQLSEKQREKVPRERVECQVKSDLWRTEGGAEPDAWRGVIAGGGNSSSSVSEFRGTPWCNKVAGGLVFGIEEERC